MRRLVEQRVALRSQLAEQSSTLLDQHPRIKELQRADRRDSTARSSAKASGWRASSTTTPRSPATACKSLTVSLDQVKKLASQNNEQDVQLRALEREAKTQRDLLESYLAKYREASARDNINAAPPEARIISRATPAIKPTYPKKTPTVLIAAFAAFALSAGFTVTGALLAPAPVAGRRLRLRLWPQRLCRARIRAADAADGVAAFDAAANAGDGTPISRRPQP